MSEIVTNKITPSTGSSDTVTLGDSGDTFNIPAGVTLANSGTATGFGGSGFTLGTEQATTSGSDKTFTGIPSGTTMVLLHWNSVSDSGSMGKAVRIGDAGGIESSGYTSRVMRIHHGAHSARNMASDSFIVNDDIADTIMVGTFIFSLQNSSTNTWNCIWNLSGKSDGFQFMVGSGEKSLSAELTQIKVSAGSGSTFDAGSLNISYL